MSAVLAVIAFLVAGVPDQRGPVAQAAESVSWMDALDQTHPRPLLEKAWTMRARERLWLAGISPDAVIRRQALGESLDALEKASRASTDARERERLTRLIGRIKELGETPGGHPAWRSVLAALAGIVRDRTRELELLEEAIATPSTSPAAR
jgi:hypothetical protein